MHKQGLDPNGKNNDHNTQDPPNVEVDMLNTIYNVCDVGVNTCKAKDGVWSTLNTPHVRLHRWYQITPLARRYSRVTDNL